MRLCEFVFYLQSVVCGLVGHLGSLLCLLEVVDDLVVGVCYIH